MPQAQTECQDISVSDESCCPSSCCSSCWCCASKLIGFLVSLISLVWIALAIAEIAIGAVYLDRCPNQRYVPIYLIVNGVTVLLIVLLGMIAGCKPSKFLFGIIGLLSLFWFAWLIAGSVWTFPLYPNYSPCNQTVYLFTFAILIIQWIVLGLSLPFVILKLLSVFSSCSSCCSSCSACSACSSCLDCSACSSCLDCSSCSSCCCCAVTKY